MPSLSIQGISVNFPFEPYPCQVIYMEKVISALSSSSNALLESPTGTGKTICLLCATLAWQSAMQPKALQLGYSAGPAQAKPKIELLTNQSATKTPTPATHCTIIYSSRTHSQLTQVIGELRTSGYTPRMTVMGSREQLCVHPKLSRMRGAALNHACNTLSSQRGCSFKNNLENYSGAAEGVGGAASPILDIEELAELGKEDKVCPYFFSRENSTRADLILLPYNYLMESSIRATMKVEWNNAIVILDEAHNIEKIASDASSCSITSSEIASCISELQQVIKLLQTKDNEAAAVPNRPNGNELSKAIKNSSNNNTLPSLHRVVATLKALFEFERRLDEIPLSKPGSNPAIPAGPQNAPSTVMPGNALARILDVSGFSIATIVETIKELKLCSEFLLDESQMLMGNAAVAEPKLSLLHKAFEKIFKGADMRAIETASSQYKVFIYEEAAPNRGLAKAKPKRVMQYWCFSPGITMEDIKKLGVRSLILTSGTLSPMDSFREDLKLPFTITLENPHVIKEKQMWVSAVSAGPRGKVLNSSFNNREVSDYKDDLGGSILVICREMLGSRSVPRVDGGVLVFFPTYAVMDSAVQRWQQTGLWDQLTGACGKIVIEGKSVTNNKSKTGFKPFVPLRIQSAEDDDNGDAPPDVAQAIASTVQEFEAGLKQFKKCLLLAVCRGKVSEGIDFKDSKGRVAIITGIPFAPFLDPWVVLKKQYLDDNKRLSSAGTVKRLNGQSWYVQSASRAVNQAVGRVIRHQKDWGAVFLLDNRFANDAQTAQLSGWVRHRVRKYENISRSLETFRTFLATAVNDPELQEKVEAAPAPRRVSRVPPKLGSTTTSEFQRRVVLPSAAISSEEEVAYIEPSLLMSQRSQQGFSMTKSYASSVSASSDFKEPDLGTLLSKIKSTHATGKTTSSQPASRDITDLFTKKNDFGSTTSYGGGNVLSAKQKDVNFVSTQSTNITKSSLLTTSRVGLRAGESITGSAGDICFNVPPPQAKSFVNPMKRSASASSTWKENAQPVKGPIKKPDFMYVTPKTETVHVAAKSSSKEDFKLLVGHLKGILSDAQFTAFIHVVKSVSKSENVTAFSNSEEVVSFVRRVLVILKQSLPVVEVRSTMKRLSFLIPAHQTSRYTKAVEDCLSASSGNMVASQRSNDVYSVDVGETLSQESTDRYSKRAKLMLQGTKGPVDSRVSMSQQLSQQSILASPIKAARTMLQQVSNFSMSTKSNSGGGREGTSSLTCSICSSSAVAPCAGRCGHVCCEQCWSTWLRIKKSCPVCRVTTTSSDVSRIIVK